MPFGDGKHVHLLEELKKEPESFAAFVLVLYRTEGAGFRASSSSQFEPGTHLKLVRVLRDLADQIESENGEPDTVH